jgi:cell division protease FtsH
MAKSPLKQNQQVRITILVVGLVMFFLLVNLMVRPEPEMESLNYSQFISRVELPSTDGKRIIKVLFKENEIIGETTDKERVRSYGPSDAELRKQLLDKGVEVEYQPPEEASLWKTILVNSIPMLLLLVLFIFFMRQLQIGGGKAMSFGKSRAKLLTENQTKITFDDVAGVEEAKHELQEIIEFLRDPKKFTKLGGRIPKGVLLIGSPGTGKTILAKAVAGEAGVPFFSISGSDFVEMFVGVGASRVRDLFDQAKKNAPCIVFIDEIDAVGRHRGAGLGGGHDEREQTLNQLLVEMDGFESNEGVIIVAATNRVDVLDPALLRPGRFDRRVVVPNPDLKGREAILKVHAKRTPLSDDVDLRVLAAGTPGFSGADLENLVNEAALMAARFNADKLTMKFFELAKDKVLMGPERKSLVMGEKERRTTAYHEAGHAIVARSIKGADPVHKVSIVPRGYALGVTVLLPEEDRVTMSKEQAEGIIAYAMGGRAAEELIFGHYTTGAGDDIKKATDIARKMVCNWGMSDKIGPLALGRQNEEVFLGREMSTSRPYSEKMAEEIDEETRRFINLGYESALSVLRQHKSKLDAMAEALLIKESLDSKDIQRILDGEQIISDEERQTYEEAQKKHEADRRSARLAASEREKPKSVAASLNPMPQGT